MNVSDAQFNAVGGGGAEFVMLPDKAVWHLAKILVEGQETLTLMRRAATAAQAGAVDISSEEREQVVAELGRYERDWYAQILPDLIAGFKLAVEVVDTFGPGLTHITDPTDVAIWNNKHRVWAAEFGRV